MKEKPSKLLVDEKLDNITKGIKALSDQSGEQAKAIVNVSKDVSNLTGRFEAFTDGYQQSRDSYSKQLKDLDSAIDETKTWQAKHNGINKGISLATKSSGVQRGEMRANAVLVLKVAGLILACFAGGISGKEIIDFVSSLIG